MTPLSDPEHDQYVPVDEWSSGDDVDANGDKSLME
jgi:hypothetical protein